MAGNLEGMLQPGERVLFHAGRSWVPNDWATELIIYGVALGTVIATGLLTFDRASLFILAAILVGPLLHWAWTIVRDWSRDAIVTARRLIHRSGWLSPKVVEIPVKEVKALRAVKEHLRITTDSTTRQLGHPHLAWALGGALAKAAGLALPRLMTRKDRLADWIDCTLMMTLWLAICLPLLRWLLGLVATPDLALWEAVSLFGCGFILANGLLPPVMTLAGLLSILVLRPFRSAEETRDWIDLSHVFWPASGESPRLNRDGLWCHRLAALVY